MLFSGTLVAVFLIVCKSASLFQANIEACSVDMNGLLRSGTYRRVNGAKNADAVIASIEVAKNETVVGRGDGAELR